MIPHGKITVVNKAGEHRTFRIKKQKPSDKFAPNSTIIGLLNGPDNTGDYLNFGFVNDDGSIKVWQSKQTKSFLWFAKLIPELFKSESELAKNYELKYSRLCMFCMHELTDPLSIDRGIGPECWKKHC